MRRLAIKGFLLVLGFLLFSALIKPLDRLADVEIVGPKIARFRQHRDRYNVLLFGSSYFYREISPAVFDEVSRHGGLVTRSFNFGIPGMDPPETYFLIDKVLAERPANVAWVLIELDHFRTSIRPRNLHTRRFEYWHDPVRTAEVARAILERDSSFGTKAKEIANHAEVFGRWLVNAGWGRYFIDSLLGTAPSTEEERLALGPDGDGFMALDDESTKIYGLRSGFFEAVEIDRFHEKRAELVRALEGLPSGDERVYDFERRALQKTVALVRRAGARPVLIVPPCLEPRASLIRLAREQTDADVLVFNDPRKYPKLYDEKLRFDLGHLNARGADEFTRALAERFSALGTGEDAPR